MTKEQAQELQGKVNDAIEAVSKTSSDIRDSVNWADLYCTGVFVNALDPDAVPLVIIEEASPNAFNFANAVSLELSLSGVHVQIMTEW